MIAETPSSPRGSPRVSRTWLVVAALVVVAALAVFAAMRRQAPPAAADCEKQPPPTAFQVAECDQGGQAPAPAATAPAAR